MDMSLELVQSVVLAHVATVTLSKFKAVGDVTEGLRGCKPSW